jgi:VWFA-related protein
MKTPRFVVSTLLLFGLALQSVSAQTQTQGEQGQVIISTTEIGLDVVVRDKRGRAIKDLTAADFQILEDDTPQEISSFRFLERAEDEKGTRTVVVPGAEQAAKPANIVAIVFDRLPQDARARSKDAALKFVDSSLNPTDFVGVFITDLSLVAVQSFTTDRAKVKKAIESIMLEATATPAESTRERVRTLHDELAFANANRAAAESGAASDGGSAVGAAASDAARLAMTIRSLEAFDLLERSQQGYATTNGLSSIVSALGGVPGRKAIVFFSEGVSIPSTVAPYFRSVISNANRSNVSFYTVDAAGLRAVSTTGETAKELAATANRRIEQALSGNDAVGGSLNATFERNEDIIREDPNSSLGQLASQTGGLYISGTNDPASRLKAVDEDLRTHYAITYQPKNQNFDGQFRRVSVVVKRQDARVQARQGYYAVNSVGALAVLPFEAKPLAVLGSGKAPQAITVRVRGLSFPQKNGTGVVPVVVQAPMSAFTFSTDEASKTFKTDFTIVAVVKDGNQQVVRKLSNHYTLSGALDKLDAARQGDVLFYRETTLDAGTYSVEAIAFDAPSDRAGTKKSSFVIAPKGTLQISSVVIVDRTERLSAEDQKMENPLRLGEMLLYPNVGSPLSKAKSKQMSFYATLNTSGTAPTKATIEILQKGQKLAELPVDLPAADASGRIQFANSLPLEAFPPGAYELKLAVTDGTTTTASSTTFSVVP